MGGIIVADFIDMQTGENKQQLYDKMKEVMANDRTKHNILPLTKFWSDADHQAACKT